MLKLKGIKKDYVTSSETVNALKGIDISFRKCEFVSILGPSGCGKTTLLNIVGGLDHYTDGDLVINGRSTKSYSDRDWDVYRNHRVGFIFQSYNLIPHQTILGNVELALTIAGVGREERIERAKRALDKVGLAGQYYKKPNQLSGGQCQRVAIARALVNDPEILLADEPTGALDTVTSVQIMELIKEISTERLVIMVTHNPELAEQYSTRIVRLLDGELLEDTNPFSEEDEAQEVELLRKEAEEKEAAESLAEITAQPQKKARKKKKEKAKMSFFTAFRLSAKNLLSKKGRTTIVGIAGSIGIIGIALVLAFSAGIKGFVVSMQDDLLSGNPIQITETAYDLNALTGMMSSEQKEEIVRDPEKARAYINSLVEYLISMGQVTDKMLIKNDLTDENYIDFVKNMDKDYYAAMLLDYGIDLTNNIFTDFTAVKGGESINYSIAALTAIYTGILGTTEYSDMTAYASSIVPSFKQAPNNVDYINSQYDVHGKIAEGKDEIMLVLNKNDELSDILLARLGYYTQDEFVNIIYKATKDPLYDKNLDRDWFDYDELLGKSFTYYPNDTVFKKNNSQNPIEAMARPFLYSPRSDEAGFVKSSGTELKVVGILTPKDTVSYGCLSSGVYYTEALTNYVIAANLNSEIAKYIRSTPTGAVSSAPMGVDQNGNEIGAGITYTYSFTIKVTEKNEEGVDVTITKTYENQTAYVGSPLTANDLMASFTGGGSGSGSQGGTGGSAGGAGGMQGGTQGGGSFNLQSIAKVRKLSLANVGGSTVPISFTIYPLSFDQKNLVTDYLDRWNADGDLVYLQRNANGTTNEVTIAEKDRTNVTYTDNLEIIISMINNMIDMVSYALIAFTSVSLVVSTVMIGIITYVSVVERIKEIGVIRSLGGRKRDVSYLFNAETFIIGLLAGLIGILVTYLVSLIVSAILAPLIGYAHIASLKLSDAVIMVLLSVGLTLISGLIPAKSAANKDPVVALRTE